MAAGKKLLSFNIPSIEQMDMDDLRERQSVVKCQTAVASSAPSPMLTAMTSSSSDRHRTGQLEKKSVSEPVQKGSAFRKSFAKLEQTSHHETIRKELENLKPELLVEPSNPPKRGTTSGAILVNPRQRGNPLLKCIRNVPWEYSDVVPDYVMGKTTCALFLSLRYHNLNPDYVHERLKQLGRLFDLRVLLVQVDVKDPHHPLKELTKIALLADCTLLLAWSAEEAGRYIETYKVFEMKPPDLLMKKQEPDSCSKILGALTSVKSVNRSDALTLMTVFGTLEGVVHATEEELSFCPGMGQLKAKKLYGVLHEPFIKPTRKSS